MRWLHCLAYGQRACYGTNMQKERIKWRATPGTRALKQLTDIEASIRALQDNDLLDFADIFTGPSPTLLGDIAIAEMTRRKISL